MQRVNRTLSGMRHEVIGEILTVNTDEPWLNCSALSPQRFRDLTFLLCRAYFFHMMTVYCILQGRPKILAYKGYERPTTGKVMAWPNVRGCCGTLIPGLFSSRLGLCGLLIIPLVTAFPIISFSGLGLSSLLAVSAPTGFFARAEVLGFYALLALSFSSEVRASGSELVISITRVGAVLGVVLEGIIATFVLVRVMQQDEIAANV